jgi:alkylation response protein AidB-like acyl-CoA dehydrogenase
MYLEVETARLMTYKAAWSFDNGKHDVNLGLVSKIISSEAAYRGTYDAVQIHGGYGYMAETDIAHFYRDAESLGLFLEPGHEERLMLADQIYNTK